MTHTAHATQGLLRVRDLSVARGGVPILDGVGFDLLAGDALILRGPNGSGKTTLLRTLAGLQPPLRGRIAAAPDTIAYAGHADGVKATLSVAENLRFWARVFGTDVIDCALVTFALDDLAERTAQNLSAGQKRRLGLARMMVTGRPVWMFDEPTVSLDAESTAKFAVAVAAHCAAGGAAIMATHIETGVAAAQMLDLVPFKAGPAPMVAGGFDEAFE